MLFSVYFHDGREDFPHGAGPSLRGYYVYRGDSDREPAGPFSSVALIAAIIELLNS